MKLEQVPDVKSLNGSTDIFNYVVLHLRKQGTKSLSPDKETCTYRGNNGTMCAVGALIADDEYDPSLEGRSIYHLAIEKDLLPTSLSNRIYPNLHMLMDLQDFHDNILEYVDGSFTEDSEIHIKELRKKWEIK